MSDHSPSVTERVQVVPLGFEYARLRDPVYEWKADRVVAVTYEDGVSVPYLEAFLDELRENDRITLETRSCDIFDLYDALGTIAGAIETYADDEVFVNLSAGSKVTAIAGMLACMATGARPIYAMPDYGSDSERVPDEPLHDAVETTVQLPTYPIETPTETEVAFLAYVDRETTTDATGRYRGASKGDLVAFARDREFPFVAASDASTDKGYYRLLDRHIVDPFREKGYVELEQVGRKKYVRLTETGRNALRAFGFRLSG